MGSLVRAQEREQKESLVTGLFCFLMFVVYIIYSKKLNRYYIGTTDDFERRYAEHNSHHFSDSFTSKVIPCDKFLVIDSLTSNQAYKIETHIKRMKSKTYISNLIKYPKIILRFKQMYL
jgi:putative endonuclease